MVYCSKCGTQNLDSNVNCTNCGAPLYGSNPQANPQDWRSHRQQRHYDREYGRRGSGIGLLIAGLIIIALGLTLFYNGWAIFWTYFWPIVLVVLGIWLLIRGLMWSQRRRR